MRNSFRDVASQVSEEKFPLLGDFGNWVTNEMMNLSEN